MALPIRWNDIEVPDAARLPYSNFHQFLRPYKDALRAASSGLTSTSSLPVLMPL